MSVGPSRLPYSSPPLTSSMRPNQVDLPPSSQPFPPPPPRGAPDPRASPLLPRERSLSDTMQINNRPWPPVSQMPAMHRQLPGAQQSSPHLEQNQISLSPAFNHSHLTQQPVATGRNEFSLPAPHNFNSIHYSDPSSSLNTFAYDAPPPSTRQQPAFSQQSNLHPQSSFSQPPNQHQQPSFGQQSTANQHQFLPLADTTSAPFGMGRTSSFPPQYSYDYDTRRGDGSYGGGQSIPFRQGQGDRRYPNLESSR